VRDPVWITPIAHHRGEPIGQPKTPIRRRQQHDTAVRGNPSAIEGGHHFLALNGWKQEWQDCIAGHGGCGTLDAVERDALRNRILRHINRLGYIRQPFTAALVNKMG
jgi:hypothetical protein